MISREQLLDAVRKKGFKHQRENDRSNIYKKPGTSYRVTVSKSAHYAADAAKTVLRDAGYTDAEIQDFLAGYGENR